MKASSKSQDWGWVPGNCQEYKDYCCITVNKMIAKYWVHALEMSRVWISNISYMYLSFYTNFKKQM